MGPPAKSIAPAVTDDDRTVFQARETSIGDTEPAITRVAAPPEPAASQALPLGFRLHEFEIQAKLGEGGFGIVYRAWDHSLGAQRAIKEYMPGAVAQREGSTVLPRSQRMREIFDSGLKRFMEEAQTLAKFDHPALVRVLRRWEDNGTAYMAMPFYEGVTLRERVRQMPEKPSEPWLMGLLAPLTEAMQVVHQNRWLHRDIAPDNILLLKDSGRPLLLDFGAARQVIGDVTQELTAILKPGFAPVEQYGETPGLEQGPWTDVYALAATMHWAIMGRTPPPSVSRVLVDNYQPLVQAAAGRYSARFLAALDKALRVDSRQRTQSMAEFRADLGLEAPAYAPTLELPSANPVRAALPDGLAFEPTAIAAPPAAAPLPYGAADVTQLMSRPGAAPLAQTLDAGLAPTLAAPAAAAPKSRLPLAIGAGLLALLALAGLAYRLQQATPAAPSPTETAPAPTTVAAPAPPPEFDWRSQVDQLTAAAAPGFRVSITGLRPEASVARQEKLRFQVHSNQDGYVTVLYRGADGVLYQAFANLPPIRIQAGKPLDFPPPGSPEWQAQEPLGQDEFVVLVSAAARVQRALADRLEDQVVLRLHGGTAATQALRAWSGPGPILAGEAQDCQGKACSDYGVAVFGVSIVP